MIIAVDFDGTLTQHFTFPEIGEPRRWLIGQILQWKQEGHKIILWTCREDLFEGDRSPFPPRKYLTEALEWCHTQGLVFDAVNVNIEEVDDPDIRLSRKVYADIYVDDRSAIFNDDTHEISFCNKPELIEIP